MKRSHTQAALNRIQHLETDSLELVGQIEELQDIESQIVDQLNNIPDAEITTKDIDVLSGVIEEMTAAVNDLQDNLDVVQGKMVELENRAITYSGKPHWTHAIEPNTRLDNILEDALQDFNQNIINITYVFLYTILFFII